MVNTMNIDEQILKELKRFNSINKYIFEQDAAGLPPAPEVPADPTALGVAPVGGEVPQPPATPTVPTPVDVASDPDVEKVDNQGESEETESGTEELDITDLVKSQKSLEEKQDGYFEELFSHLQNLETKLADMDELFNKINSLESKIETMRPKTPTEKLELRSLDSAPFNQKLTDFFEDKEVDMQKSGKNEYVLTTDEVKDFSPSEIQDTFYTQDEDEDEFKALGY